MGLIIKKGLEIIFEIIGLIIYYFALIMSLYFILIHILFLLFPEEQIISRAVNNFFELELIWPEIIFLSTIGWFINLKAKRLALISPFSLTLDEQITYLITAYLFAAFFKGSYSIFAKLGIFSIVILTSAFFIILPQIASFFLSFSLFNFINSLKRSSREILLLIKTPPAPHLSHPRQTLAPQKLTPATASKISFKIKKLMRELIKPLPNYLNRLPSIWAIFLVLFSLLSFIMLTAFVFIFIIIITTSYIDKKIKQENKLKQSFYISEIKPKVITYATEVTIKGYNLGWNWKNKAKMQSDYGEIPIGLWTDRKIVFIVPLHLKEGKFKVWLERLEGDLSDKIIASNKVGLELVPAAKYSLFDDINIWDVIFKEK